jgi:membrane protein implicated in regulation of membrane protease activity
MLATDVLDVGLLAMLVLFLGGPLTAIAVLMLISGKGRFSLKSVVVTITVVAILLGYASYVLRINTYGHPQHSPSRHAGRD